MQSLLGRTAWKVARSEARRGRLKRTSSHPRYVDGMLHALEPIRPDDPIALGIQGSLQTPLDRLLKAGPLPLEICLSIAIAVVRSLQDLHRHARVHRQVWPSNILVDPCEGRVSLLGVGLASPVPRQAPRTRPVPRQADVAYLSPEESGWANRTVDYRSDYYSLGVVFFEMLSGRLPFADPDPRDLVAAHLTQKPPDLVRLRSGAPRAVAAIVEKLLSKAAEDRYQGGDGLEHDLRRCLREWETKGEVAFFSPGQADVPEHFELPQNLYGRDTEVHRLSGALDSALDGQGGVFLVTGAAGIGKTSIVGELARQVFLRQGCFACAKFEERGQGRPMSGILGALRGLVEQVLGESPQRRAVLKQELGRTLQADLGVLTEVIPELQLIVGNASPAPVLESVDDRNRFHDCVRRLLKTLAGRDRPLVLFLDDLQWIDPSSLELVESFFTERLDSFLLLGSYREHEVGEDHPLLRTLERIKRLGVGFGSLELGPLSPHALGRFVADTVGEGTGRIDLIHKTAPLTDLLWRKSGGNPLFAKELLTTFHQCELLYVAPGPTGSGRIGSGPAGSGPAGSGPEPDGLSWHWDLPAIARMAESVGDGVGALTTQKLVHLGEVRHLIVLAAALADPFDVAGLASIVNLPAAEIESRLVEACRQGILMRQGDDYRFVHDQHREGAYALIPQEDREKTHLYIGRLLRARAQEDDTPEGLFAIADHLNRGSALLKEPGEREAAARLNLEAGRKARGASAFPAALMYLATGIELLDSDAWRHGYELSLALYTEAAEAALLTGDLVEAVRLANVVRRNVRA